jgi:hypothetical protein
MARQVAVRPFGGFDFAGIKVIAEHALKFGPAGKAGCGNHSLSAVQTSRDPVHRSPPPLVFTANTKEGTLVPDRGLI